MAQLAMMNKRIFLFGLLTIAAYTLLSAQGLRTSVCVVYPECNQEDSALLVTYARPLARIGFTSDAAGLRAYVNHSFGSGVLTDRFVLTNRHVVGYAKTVKLVFMLHEKTLTFEHCPVVSVSQQADIAAIMPPADLSDLYALPLSSEAVQDGEDIFAAGFPGLNNNPSWQLTKGMVSNAHLLLDGIDFIQHTAAIDPGSSGGPLLRKKDGKYEIIGLNTMKAFMRDRVGMAVNAADIQAFLSAKADTTHQHLLEQFRDVDMEQIVEYYRQLPDSMKTVLHNMEVRLPMDRLVAISEYYGGAEQLQKKPTTKATIQVKNTDKRLTQNKAGIDHVRDIWSVFVSYDALTPIKRSAAREWTQIVSVNGEIASGYLLYGAVLSVPIAPAIRNGYISGKDTIPAQSYTSVGVSGGLRFGAHMPVRLNASHVIIPKITIDGIAGQMISNSKPIVYVPIRIGVDYRYQFQNASLIMGAHYMIMPAFEFSNGSKQVYHGIDVRMGVAF